MSVLTYPEKVQRVKEDWKPGQQLRLTNGRAGVFLGVAERRLTGATHSVLVRWNNASRDTLFGLTAFHDYAKKVRG